MVRVVTCWGRGRAVVRVRVGGWGTIPPAWHSGPRCPNGTRQANCQDRLLRPNQKPSMTLSTLSESSPPEAAAAPSAT